MFEGLSPTILAYNMSLYHSELCATTFDAYILAYPPKHLEVKPAEALLLTPMCGELI